MSAERVMPIASHESASDTPGRCAKSRLGALEKLAAADIVSPVVADLSRDLHSLFDPVCDDTLPIYFGPLLGRLYLEGL